jgi:hypothetical protein
MKKLTPYMILFHKMLRTFPVLLLVLHIRNRFFFLFPWILLTLWVSSLMQWEYGIPLLFLKPEYLLQESYSAHFILGAALGGLIMTWQITSYLLDVQRFRFLANLARPFAIFGLNNSLIPVMFVIAYSIFYIKYELKIDSYSLITIAQHLLSFYAGILLFIGLASCYFTYTNRNIFRVTHFALEDTTDFFLKKIQNIDHTNDKWSVHYFLNLKGQIRKTRNLKIFKDQFTLEVIKQHHFNFFIAQVIVFFTFFIVGLFIENKYFHLPTACSIIFFLSLCTSFFGFFKFLTNRWSTIAFLSLFVLINYSTKLGLNIHQNYAYGFDYKLVYDYNQTMFDSMTKRDTVLKDINQTLAILAKWKAKQKEEKPKLIIINASGGGLAATMFTTRMIQLCDDSLAQNLFPKTVMMSGASGGAIGLNYMRGLYLDQLKSNQKDLSNIIYCRSISRDLLNSMTMANISNDIFFPFRKYIYNGHSYDKDRAYIFEKQLNENAQNLLSGSLSDYQQYESDAVIPLMINNCTVVNDFKQLLLTAQPMSYMMKPFSLLRKPDRYEVDMIDGYRMFLMRDSNQLKLTTALRMTATYPFIMPSMTLPTSPAISVMDGGIRDNNSIQITYKFLHTFKQWINDNTSGVVVIQIKYFPKFKKIKDAEQPSTIEKFVNPIGKIYSNIFEIQDYEQDLLMNALNEDLRGQLNIVRFGYTSEIDVPEASLSFHLTAKEKENIIKCTTSEANQKELSRLKKLMNIY